MVKNINANHKLHRSATVTQEISGTHSVKKSANNNAANMSGDIFTSAQTLDNYNNYSKGGALLADESDKSPSSESRVNISLTDLIQQKRNERSFLLERIAEDRESARAIAEALAEEARIWQILLEIFRRIIRGDNVSKSDENFLAEKNPGLFMMAMTARQENENPEDHESIAPSENNSNYSDYSSDSGNISSTSAPSIQQTTTTATAASGQASSSE